MSIILRKYLMLLFLPCVIVNAFSQSRDLDFYIQAGIKNSSLLNDINNRLSATTLDSLLIIAARRPVIEGRSGALYAPYGNNIGYDEVITDGGNYEALGVISQEIFTGKLNENKLRSVSNLKMGIGINKKITEAELKKTITDLYLDSYSAYSDLNFNKSFFGLISEQEKIMLDFVKAGIYSQSDYLALSVELKEQEILTARYNNIYRKNLGLLNELCGLADSTVYELQVPFIELTESVSPPNFLVLKQFITDSLKIVNERNSISLRYRPTVSWIADAGFLTSKPWNFYNHFGVSGGISLSVPIYDGQQKRLEEKKLDISESTRLFYNDNYRKIYEQKYLSLKDQLKGMKEVRNKLGQQSKIAEQLVNALRSQLETGLVRMNDYLAAIKSYRNINHNLNLADIEVSRIINEINYITSE
jgi:hypothetical protein